MFLSCPKKWSLQYKEGHKIPSFSINMTFGTAVHETLQNYLSVMYNESGVKADAINIEEYFEERFRENYAKGYKDNKNVHFSSPKEMREFYDDGLAILDFIKKKRSEYFSLKDWHLVGIEMPIVIAPNKTHNNVLFNGFIDLVLYHEPTNQFIIYDIKTSTRGWKDKEKKDEVKQFQILLYKSNGKTKVKKAKTALGTFIEETFNLDGSYKTVSHQATPSKWACAYCPYKLNKELCNEAILK
jgi:hypothetical protein